MEQIKALLWKSLSSKETFGEHLFDDKMIDFILGFSEKKNFHVDIVEYCRCRKNGIPMELPEIELQDQQVIITIAEALRLLST
jgi:hypothetical protein